jgi:hypothetical protein
MDAVALATTGPEPAARRSCSDPRLGRASSRRSPRPAGVPLGAGAGPVDRHSSGYAASARGTAAARARSSRMLVAIWFTRARRSWGRSRRRESARSHDPTRIPARRRARATQRLLPRLPRAGGSPPQGPSLRFGGSPGQSPSAGRRTTRPRQRPESGKAEAVDVDRGAASHRRLSLWIPGVHKRHLRPRLRTRGAVRRGGRGGGFVRLKSRLVFDVPLVGRRSVGGVRALGWGRCWL